MDNYGNTGVNWFGDLENTLMQMGLALQKKIPGYDYETVIVGLGETGFSVAKFFHSQGRPFMIVDSRSNPPQLQVFKKQFPSVVVSLGEFSKDSFKYAKKLIVSPGIDVGNRYIQSAIGRGAKCIGDIELFVHSTQKPIVAITGSNGKSTVTSLVAKMANSSNVRTHAGGNLSPPALDLLNYEGAELFVLELSSFQLETTCSLKSQVSAVLNISPDHLDRHGTVESYARIKEKVYEGAKFSVVNRNDPFVSSMKTSGEVITFGMDQPVDGEFGLIQNSDEIFLAKGSEQLLSTKKLAMRGESGILNSLAALAIGEALVLPMGIMIETLSIFKGLPHRFYLVRELQGVSWFNDSKGTNIGATISSLRSLKNNIILLLGGVFKGGDLDLLKSAVSEHVKHVILFGQDANVFKKVLEGVAEIQTAKSMHDAVYIANKISKEGDNVLLSPACASFDMYKDYTERGKDFESCVKAL